MKKIVDTISIAIFFTNACKESPKENGRPIELLEKIEVLP
tara:strand:+ start:288 stop:407 length:120 start_codon:yes stop_codon:yes gene_type:complete